MSWADDACLRHDARTSWGTATAATIACATDAVARADAVIAASSVWLDS